MIGTLKSAGLWLLGLVTAILYALRLKSKEEFSNLEAEMANGEAERSIAQLKQLEKAQQAARSAGANDEQEITNVRKKVRSGDLSGMDNTG